MEQIREDARNKNRFLVGVVVCQGLLLLGFATWGSAGAPPATAQIPDAGAQRQQLVEEMRALGAKVDKIAQILESGQLQVRVAPPDVKDR